VSDVLLNVFSANRLSESIKGRASFSQNGAYNEEAFRYLLESESKRSERSGHCHQILLVYHTNVQGAIVRMDSALARTVIRALSCSLRETDYIGWYRTGCVVGGVLTVVGRDAVSDVSNCVQSRLLEILRADLGVEQSASLRLRIFQQEEVIDVESGEESLAANQV
jgi:hypothetical protein